MSVGRNVSLDRLLDNKIFRDDGPSYRDFIGVMLREDWTFDQVASDPATHGGLAGSYNQKMKFIADEIMSDDVLRAKFIKNITDIYDIYKRMPEYEQELFSRNIIEARAEKKSKPDKAATEPVAKTKIASPVKSPSIPITKAEHERRTWQKRITDEIAVEWQGKPPEDRSNLFMISELKSELVKLHKGDSEAARQFYDGVINKSYPLPKVQAGSTVKAQSASVPKDKEEIVAPKKDGRLNEVWDKARELEDNFKKQEKTDRLKDLLEQSRMVEEKFKRDEAKSVTVSREDHENAVRKIMQTELKRYIEEKHSDSHKKMATHLLAQVNAKKPLSEIQSSAALMRDALKKSSRLSRKLFSTTGGKLDRILDGIVNRVDESGLKFERDSQRPKKK